MQALFIVLLVIFSMGIGFFLGILVLSMNAPLRKAFGIGADKREEEDEQPSVDAGPEETAERDEEEKQPSPDAVPEKTMGADSETPSADARLLLQIWQIDEDTLLYGFQGEYVTKTDLPDNILALLSPAETVSEREPDPDQEPEEKAIQEALPGEEVEEADIEPLSLISEIDEILQKKLEESPLNNKGIKLTENHKKEITIWVGLKSYPSIEDVPDPEIQRMIKESVRDWEDRKK